ncbi:MAG: ParB/RepB/Spo0J family partition protein [Clostridia bacterium]|nr:ParB/RepB/Spo0J family partition protein [Clostridia bacterium]
MKLLQRFDFKKNDEKEKLKNEWDKLNKRKKQLKNAEDACRVHLINPDRICPNPSQPRTVFSDSSIMSLADSIKRHGIIQPISIRRVSDEDTPFGGLYEVIAGERRLRAAKLLNMEYVPCVILDVDKEASAKLALVENLQREGLNIFEEASAILSLAEKYSLKQEEIAALLSVSQSYVANKIRLLRLSEPERELIIKNDLSERHARSLIKIHDPVLRLKTLGYIIEHSLNVRESEEYIKKILFPSVPVHKPVRKMIIRDIRIFLNSLDRAVSTVKEAGIPIEQSRVETDDSIELTIKIPR